MPKFRKKPVVIDAEQFILGEGLPTGVVSVWVDQHDDGLVLCLYNEEPSKPGNVAFGIRTLEGWQVVRHGDWIVTGIAGEKYPVKPGIFEATYEPVEDSAEEPLDWDKAKAHLDYMQKAYEEIGPTGRFAFAITIMPLQDRYARGERTKWLYDEIMEVE